MPARTIANVLGFVLLPQIILTWPLNFGHFFPSIDPLFSSISAPPPKITIDNPCHYNLHSFRYSDGALSAVKHAELCARTEMLFMKKLNAPSDPGTAVNRTAPLLAR